MSTQEEKAWASALATKYGIREPVAPELDELDDIIAWGSARAWMTTATGTPPISTAHSS